MFELLLGDKITEREPTSFPYYISEELWNEIKSELLYWAGRSTCPLTAKAYISKFNEVFKKHNINEIRAFEMINNSIRFKDKKGKSRHISVGDNNVG